MLSEVFIESVQARIKQAPKIIYQRGIEIFLHSGKNIEVLEESFFDEGGTSIVLVVPSQSSSSGYAVTFENLKANTLVQECVCPYGQDNSFCKHIVAAGLYLQSRFRSSGHEREVKSVEKGIASIPSGKPNSEYSYRIPLINFNTYFVDNATKVFDYNAVNKRSAKAVSLFEIEPNKRWSATVVLAKESKDVDFYCDDYNNLVLERNYPQAGNFLDRFEAAALREALDSYPRGYFQSLINFEDQKKKILGQYGLSLNDPEAIQFRFSNSNGKLEAQPPENLLKVSDNEQLTKWAGILHVKSGNSNPLSAAEQKEIYELGLLFNFSRTTYCGFSFEPLRVIQQASKISFKKMPFKHPSDVNHLEGLPRALKHDFIQLTDKSIEQRISATRERYHYYSQTDPAIITEVQEFYFDFFHQHLNYLASFPALYQLAEGERLSANTVRPVMLSTQGYSLSFALEIEEKMVSLQAFIMLGKKRIRLEKASLGGGFIARQNELLYLPENKEDISLCNIFKDGAIRIHKDGIQNFLTQLVIPLSNKYPVDFPESFETELYEKIDEKAVYLRELSEKFLLIQPAFKYGNTVLEYDGAVSEHFTTFADNTVTRIIRQKAEEDEFVKWMKTLNPDFNRQFTNPYFYVSFAQAMKNKWFIDFCHALREAGVSVYGINELKKFKYNTNKPVFEMKAGSGIDWFDIKIEVHFGEQAVGIKELRKAMVNHDPYILLDDGTIGVLPDDWFEKYSMLFKMGSVNADGGLQLSKFHFTIIDELYSQIDNDQVLAELADKREKLKNISLQQSVKVPGMKNVKLRPYQESGFQWMNTLDEMEWGGCLADDMGLGKTLQTLTFIVHLTKKHPKSTHLIVCPTSLIFNWENEINKYAPKLNYHIYYGSERAWNEDHFDKHDIIITSYGTLRNDIEHFNRFAFHYVILDESQAIKNPTAKLTKAVQLIKAKNKLILSGTPVQNNTFDLYAQFNFLNPGMLGNMDFFKQQFANPIDKEGDQLAAKQLQKLIYPFMLRRTKEQVAKDLPARTEMIMYCEMGTEQRKIYNQFKEHYREYLLNKIKEEGIGKSGIYILEGLTKLRQICDSPALLNEEKHYPNESTKLTELIREIEENVGQHKVLVFSQFVGMLNLIRNQLEDHRIAFEYIDGSVTAQNRQKAVDNFQKNDEVKVFLISLKAGGVGLNLTAADYVYLVDPWWNPAVEQQAIDRTHRIGQTRKIFAYKMICKDSIEEKIIQLQEKKKSIAAGIIKEENGFLKKLTKDDIEFLFS